MGLRQNTLAANIKVMKNVETNKEIYNTMYGIKKVWIKMIFFIPPFTLSL